MALPLSIFTKPPKPNQPTPPAQTAVPGAPQMQMAQLSDPTKMAEQLGLSFDPAEIQKVYQTGTDAANQAAQVMYAKNMANSQMTAMDMIRKTNAKAVATGASKGIQAAQQLATTLGFGQEANVGATKLAYDAQTAAAQNAVNAFNLANSNKLGMGNMAVNKLAADAQQVASINTSNAQMFGSNVGANAAIQQALATIEAAKLAANAQITSAGITSGVATPQKDMKTAISGVDPNTGAPLSSLDAFNNWYLAAKGIEPSLTKASAMKNYVDEYNRTQSRTTGITKVISAKGDMIYDARKLTPAEALTWSKIFQPGSKNPESDVAAFQKNYLIDTAGRLITTEGKAIDPKGKTAYAEEKFGGW